MLTQTVGGVSAGDLCQHILVRHRFVLTQTVVGGLDRRRRLAAAGEPHGAGAAGVRGSEGRGGSSAEAEGLGRAVGALLDGGGFGEFALDPGVESGA